MEPRDLGERGIRYVKVPASFLLDEAGSAGSDIHAADLSDLLGRFGISLIAERIEGEAQVVDLLEYDVRFGQGFLFSQPRPVRAEALRGAAEDRRRSAGRSPTTAQGRRGRIGRRALIATPSFTEHFSTLAGGYDAVLSDVWGVIHNGVAATAAACDALTRFRGQGGTVMLITNAPRPGEVVTRFLDKLSVPHERL